MSTPPPYHNLSYTSPISDTTSKRHKSSLLRRVSKHLVDSVTLEDSYRTQQRATLFLEETTRGSSSSLADRQEEFWAKYGKVERRKREE
jgi:hypothetical protein